jgi:hypothetical protein
LAAFIAVAACAANAQIVDHAFGFDTRYDGQEDVEVLGYRYGYSKNPVHAEEERVKQGQVFSFDNVSGDMLRGEFLYVKWRIKSTGAVYEDKVDLRDRLPANIARHRITFLIRGPQLYVYLVPPEDVRRPKGKPPNGPHMYQYLDTVTLYPDSPKP